MGEKPQGIAMDLFKWFRKKKVVYEFPEYKVDITKPPIWPPLVIIYSSIVGEYETDFSVQRTKAWEKYMEDYRNALSTRKRPRKKKAKPKWDKI
jgi:hypothetical protein